MFTINIVGAPKFEATAERMAVMAGRAAVVQVEYLAEGGEIVLRHLRQHAPAKTGAGRDSLEARHQADGVHFWGLRYLGFQITGTVPHMIYPRQASVLHWIGDGGEHHFARFVRHPGTRPNDFRYPAVRAARPELEALALRLGHEVIR